MQIEFFTAAAAVIAANSGHDDLCEGRVPSEFRCAWIDDDHVLVELAHGAGFYSWNVRIVDVLDAHGVVRRVEYRAGSTRGFRCA